jgi:hypothetical protein
MSRSSVLVEHECPTARGKICHGIHPWMGTFDAQGPVVTRVSRRRPQAAPLAGLTA